MEERRRSQRVILRVPVIIHVVLDGKPEKLPASTVGVNIYGAMLSTARSLPAETCLEIEHKLTRERKPGRVVRQPQGSPEGFLIPVEFDAPSGEFWHISFPPSDWEPSES
jgi:hypothetical protein